MNAAFYQFRAAVLADPQAQRELAEAERPGCFEAKAIPWAAARGITLDAMVLRQPRSQAKPLTLDRAPGPGWLPVSVTSEGNVEWLHFAGVKPQGPFFDDDRHRAAVRPFNRLFACRSPLAALTEGNKPDGLVFHMSRSGSTLVAQMLGAPPGIVAIAEPAALGAVVQLPGLAPAQRIAAVRGVAGALGQGEPGLQAGGHYVLKLDSWHSRALPLFREAFPDVPWVFVYREPVEVLVSHLRRRGVHTVPGLVPPETLGLAPGESGVPVEDYIARVLARVCEGILEHWRLGGGLLVNYRELPDAVFGRILAHFGLPAAPEALAAMREAALRDAKAPDTGFTPDSAAKRQAAGSEVHLAAERHLRPIYARLEALRIAQRSRISASSPR